MGHLHFRGSVHVNKTTIGEGDNSLVIYVMHGASYHGGLIRVSMRLLRMKDAITGILVSS